MMTTVLLWLLMLAVGAFIVYSHFFEPKCLELTHRRISLPGLPPELEGLTIAHLSDLHIKSPANNFSYEIAEQAVALALAQRPDLVCLTGDLGHASRHVDRAAEVLAPLAIFPAYAVMGNHDHDKVLENDVIGPPAVRCTPREWRSTIEAVGIHVLQNEHTVLKLRGSEVVIAGVGDPSCGWDDLPEALEGVPEGDLRLLLVHSPDLLDEPDADWADLVLCGHTHGGQVNLPGIGCPWAPVWRDRARAEGLLAVGDTHCFITRGIAAGLRTRFRCRPQVALLTLTSGAGDRTRRRPRLPLPEH
ncbi:MAG: metallophosphoesterase [Armatimonadia bacterium]